MGLWELQSVGEGEGERYRVWEEVKEAGCL